ncbi:hypothetical protein MKX03_015085 [Papaver bracteatum]|nr:hypothetical protein MKX03_015085 [Papaver bracteatum]
MDEIREATRTGNVKSLNTILDANPHFPLATPKFTSFLRTPLHEASIRGHVEFAKVIMNRNPAQRPQLAMEVDTQGFAPLHLASTRDNVNMVRVLIDAYPNACVVPDQNGRTPLHLAAMRDQVEVMELLIQKHPEAIHRKLVNTNDTILHLCVKHDKFKALKLLIDYLLHNRENPANIQDPISVNSVDCGGNTILHLAAQLKRMEMLRYLMTSTDDIGIDINIRNNEEVTALQMLDRYEMQSLVIGCYDTSEGPEPSATSNNEWLRERLNTIMIVATLIGGIAFQAVINPPGGVFQDDSKIDSIEHPVRFTYYLRNFISYPSRPRGFQSLESYIQNQLGNITADKIIDSRVAFVLKLYSAAKSNDSHTSPVSPNMTRKLGTGIVLEDWWMNITSNYNNTMGGRSGFSPYLLRYSGTAIMAYAFPNAYASYIILNSLSLVVCGLTILIVTFDAIIQRPSESTARIVRYLEVLVAIAVACISLSYMIVIKTIAPPFWEYDHVYSQLGEKLIAVPGMLICFFAFLLGLSLSREQALGHPFFKRFIWRRNSRIHLFVWLIVKIIIFLLVLLILWISFIKPLG